MKKVNIDEKVKAINEFRVANLNKTFTGQELSKQLIGLGFSKIVSAAVAQRCFPYEQLGKGRLYEVPKEPIYKAAISSVYNKINSYGKKKKMNSTTSSSSITQQQAWDTLVEAGIIKTKFNLNILKSKYPKIYLECLEYELNPSR